MAIVFETKRFNRVGRQSGEKKVVDREGKSVEIYVDENGKEIDNSYEAKQVKEESISVSDGASLLNDSLELADGDLSRLRGFIVSGANQTLRLEAGGYTPEEKVARMLLKTMPGSFEGLSTEQVVELVKGLKKTA